MPQTKAAKKSLRQSIRRRAINDRWRKAVRDVRHTMREALTNKDKKTAEQTLLTAQKTFDRAAKHKIIHPNKAARLKSRMTKAVNSL